MSRPIVYGQPFHLHVRTVLFALKEKQVAYRLETADKPEAPAKDASRVSAFGEPVLDVGGFVVEGAETALRFVADGFTGPALQPTEPRERARMNRALELNYAEACTTLGLRIAGRYLAAVFAHEWLDPQVSKDVLSNARKTIEQFERLLGSDQFLAGARLSIADIAFGALLDNIMEAPEGDLVVPQGSRLRDWWNGISVRPAFTSTRPKGGALFGFWYANTPGGSAATDFDLSVERFDKTPVADAAPPLKLATSRERHE